LDLSLHQESLLVTFDAYSLAYDLIENHLSKSLGSCITNVEAEIGHSIQSILQFKPNNGKKTVSEEVWNRFSKDVIQLI
jgi:hypothetical protein